LQDAIDVSFNSDIIYCVNITQTANVAIKSLNFYIDTTSNITLNISNAGGGGNTQNIDGNGKLTLAIGAGNGLKVNVKDIQEIEAITSTNTTNNGALSIFNVKKIGNLSLGFNGGTTIQFADEVGDISSYSTSALPIRIYSVKSVSSITQNDAGNGRLTAKLANIARLGAVLIKTRNPPHSIYAKNVNFYTDATPCIRSTDTGNVIIALEQCRLRSNNTNIIDMQSSIGVTLSMYIKNIIRDGEINTNRTLSNVLDIENTLTTIAIIDNFSTI